MSINAVSIDEYNFPLLPSHELYLHSLNHIVMTASWGQGYPGFSGKIDPITGAIHLTPFRLIFVPDHPTESLYSLSFPVLNITSITPSFPPTSSARDYNDRFTIDHQFLSNTINRSNQEHGTELDSLEFYHGLPRSHYAYTKTCSPNTLSFRCKPCHNSHVPEIDIYQGFLSQGGQAVPNLKLKVPPSTRIDRPIDVQLSLGPNSCCLVHTDRSEAPQEGEGDDESPIACYHPDFLFSLLRTVNLASFLQRATLHFMDKTQPPSREMLLQHVAAVLQEYSSSPPNISLDTAKPTAQIQTREYLRLKSEQQPVARHGSQYQRPRQHPDSPLLLAYNLAAHSTQPLYIFSDVANRLAIHPFEVYSEWPL